MIRMVARTPTAAAQPAGGQRGHRHGAVVDHLAGADHPSHHRGRNVALPPGAADHIAGDHRRADQHQARDHQIALAGSPGQADQQRGRPADQDQPGGGASGAEPGGDPVGHHGAEQAADATQHQHHPDRGRGQLQPADQEQHQQGLVAGQPEVGRTADQGERRAGERPGRPAGCPRRSGRAAGADTGGLASPGPVVGRPDPPQADRRDQKAGGVDQQAGGRRQQLRDQRHPEPARSSGLPTRCRTTGRWPLRAGSAPRPAAAA